MWAHFLNILWRIIHGMPVLVSSNWAAWILGILTFGFTELLLFMGTAREERWKRLKGNVLIGLLVTVFVYSILFVWSTVQTTYDDHHDSVGRWQSVVNEKENLKAELRQRDDYIRSLEARACPQCPSRGLRNGAVIAVPPVSETIHEVLVEAAGPPLRFWQRWEPRPHPSLRFCFGSPLGWHRIGIKTGQGSTESFPKPGSITPRNMLPTSVVPTFTKNVKVGQPSVSAPERMWASHYLWFLKGENSRRRDRDVHLCLAPLIDSHGAFSSESITSIAAPRPLLRLLHQATGNGIAVHIAKLLDPLARRPHIEIVEASLPHVFGLDRKVLLCSNSASANRLQNAARESLFDRLHHPRWIPLFRFADQQMNVVGHNDVADHHKAVTLADLLEHYKKKIAML
jgi:hypothetical protein